MRPLLFDVDVTLSPARMTICFPGRPNRFIVVRIRSAARELHQAQRAALRELEAFTPEQLQLLAESSAPAPIAPDPAPPEAMITKVEVEHRYAGSLFCPACCHRLGLGISPAIGYLRECPSCSRQLAVRFSPGIVTIVLQPERNGSSPG